MGCSFSDNLLISAIKRIFFKEGSNKKARTSSQCNLFFFLFVFLCPYSCNRRQPAGDDVWSVQADPAERGPHRALQRPGPQLPQSHPCSQHQLRGVRAPEDTAGSDITLRLTLSLSHD